MRILHAEDDRIIAGLVEAMVGYTEHTLEQVEDADAACIAIEAHHYDLLITDYRMGKTTGETVIQCAQAHRIPRIVLCSADDLSELAARYRVEFLSKPFDVKALNALFSRPAA